MVALTSARRASRSDAMAVLARFGLAARAFVYLVIGVLALEIALGHRGQEADQRGALAAIAQHSYGIVLLWALGLGFSCYSIWRLSEAALGTATDGDKSGPRAKSLARGIIYAAFAASTFAFIAGTSRQGQAQQQETLTARIMNVQTGRWAVGIVGAIVVVVGASMVVEAVTRKFEKQLDLTKTSPTTHRIVVTLGLIGTTARGIVFAIAGGLSSTPRSPTTPANRAASTARSAHWRASPTARGYSLSSPSDSLPSASSASPQHGGPRSKAQIGAHWPASSLSMPTHRAK